MLTLAKDLFVFSGAVLLAIVVIALAASIVIFLTVFLYFFIEEWRVKKATKKVNKMLEEAFAAKASYYPYIMPKETNNEDI